MTGTKKLTKTQNNAVIARASIDDFPGYTAIIKFKWRVSRGRETYGYNICSCYVNNFKVGSTCGGGYDMQGAALAEFINTVFSAELATLPAYYKADRSVNKSGMYGLYEYHDGSGAYVDGSCGLNCMVSILEALGYVIRYVCNDTYTITKKQ